MPFSSQPRRTIDDQRYAGTDRRQVSEDELVVEIQIEARDFTDRIEMSRDPVEARLGIPRGALVGPQYGPKSLGTFREKRSERRVGVRGRKPPAERRRPQRRRHRLDAHLETGIRLLARIPRP